MGVETTARSAIRYDYGKGFNNMRTVG